MAPAAFEPIRPRPSSTRWRCVQSTGRPGRHHLGAATVLCLATVACARGGEAAMGGDAPTDRAAPTSADASEAGEPALALPVVADEARDGDLVLRVTTTGQVRSDAAVRPGTRVARGQPLVRFDPYPFDLAVREAQAAADEAEQRFLESFVPESLVTGIGPSPDQRRALMNKSGLAGARLRLERARWEQERAVVRSPFDGVVDAVDVAAGERLASGQPLLTVVDTRNLRVEALVLEHDLPLVRVGGEALVSSAGAPGERLTGRIEAVLPLVDSLARAGRAIVRIPGTGVLRPGMFADVQLEATRLPGRRLVPARAIIERDGRPLVFVVRDGRAQWTYVLPGRSNGADTELLPDSASGVIPVSAGDPVIVEGHLTLTHDAPVRVTPARVTPARERSP
jgi:RND family efflux transporter MFP subunit